MSLNRSAGLSFLVGYLTSVVLSALAGLILAFLCHADSWQMALAVGGSVIGAAVTSCIHVLIRAYAMDGGSDQ